MHDQQYLLVLVRFKISCIFLMIGIQIGHPIAINVTVSTQPYPDLSIPYKLTRMGFHSSVSSNAGEIKPAEGLHESNGSLKQSCVFSNQ